MIKKAFTLLSLMFATTFAFCQQRVDGNELEVQTKYLEARKEMEAGKFDKGLGILETLYKENRTNAGLNFELAKAYASKNDFISVEKYGGNAIKYAPENEWFQLFYGKYMLENNRPETALACFDKLIQDHPTNGDYYQYKVDALVALNKVDEAVKVFDLLETKIGAGADIYLSRFDLLDNAGKNDRAIEELNKLTAAYPEEKKYLKIKAGFYTKIGKEKDAKMVYQKVLELDPNDVEANVAMLDENSLNENSDAYLRTLLPIISDQSIDIDTKVKEILPYVNNLSKGNGTVLKGALQEIGNKLILTHPDEAKAHALYGDILTNSGELTHGAAEYEKALSISNKSFAVYEQLMYIYFDQMQYEKLYKTSNAAIDFFPNESISFYFMTMALLQQGKVADAASYAEEGLIIASSNKVKSSMALSSQAAVFLAKKEYDKALASINKALELSEGKNGFAHEVNGDILMAQQNVSQAKKEWQQAKDLGINSKRLIAKLDGPSN